MTADNRDIAYRDVIAEVVHATYGEACDHNVGVGTWSGTPDATPCVTAAQDALIALAEADIHVVRDDAATDGHRHVVMFVDSDTRDRLRARLHQPDMIGVGYSAFIEHAIRLSRELHDMLARAAHEGAQDEGGCNHRPGWVPACDQIADDQMAREGSWTR